MMRDEQLEALYRLNWDALCKSIPTDSGVSNPLLAAVPQEYEHSKKRLLVIGQETHGWWGRWDANPANQISVLHDYYRRFDRGRKHNSPFFHAAKKLQVLLNPDSDPFGFIWLNLFVCDQNNGQPREPVAESLRKVSFLRDEIKILGPYAVVFFTGPNYDYTLKHERYFPDAELKPRSKWWSEVMASGLPTKTARTYHPNHLQLERQTIAVLKEIADWINQ
jgi:hypothetical protein